MPVSHGEGNYFASGKQLEEIEKKAQVVFRYVDAQGTQAAGSNPNGSVQDIAGICNDRGNVVGLMPHPDRAIEALLGSTDGRAMFESVVMAKP